MVFSAFLDKLKIDVRDDREFSLYLLVGFMLGLGNGIYNAIFPNWLNAVYGITETQRGLLEVPREGAGLIVMFVVGLMAFLGDIRLSRVTMVLQFVGVFGMSLLAPRYSIMMMWLFIYSLGSHVFMPLTSKIGMSLSTREHFGMRLARYAAFGLVAGIIGNGVVWVTMRLFHVGYRPLFICAGVCFVGAAIAMGLMTPDRPTHRRPKFVFRKQYSLYYALCLVSGARQQIFLTFAPWVLVTVFSVDAPTFAVLGVVISVVQIGTRTIVGRAIDRIGERKVLGAEAVLLLLVCFGYAFSGKVFTAAVAVVLIAACYVLDSSMSVVEMARSTYMRKIAVDEADVTSTLSTGTSITHIASMSIPTLGGLLWAATGSYQPVFMVAGGIAVINMVLTSRIKIASRNSAP
ncbi:MAG: MFS transporter [Propionibacteriaceae bacterium]|nr:MFS transporter [Propionibacteriaceae bacterium]